MSVGVVFASTGGTKILRTIRSFRRAEPNIPIHVVFDVKSRTWGEGNNSDILAEVLHEGVKVNIYDDNTNHWINGTLNAAVGWMGKSGYDYACLFHDDLVFSPLQENKGHVSEWFEHPCLEESSGLSFSLMECFAINEGCVEGQPGNWQRSSAEWDSIDLESEEIWNKLLPGGKTAGYFGEGGTPGRVGFPTWFIHCYVSSEIQRFTRLGPTGQIIPIDTWEKVGKFDEKEGLVYDMDYPARCAVEGLPPVYVIPNTPHLHLHNQSIGYADPAHGLWGNCLESFIRHYGKDPHTFWEERGYKKL